MNRNKVFVWLGAMLLGVALSPAQAAAQDQGKSGSTTTKAQSTSEPAEGHLLVEITSDLALRARVNKDAKYLTCKVAGGPWQNVSAEGVVAESGTNDFISGLFMRYLMKEPVWCTTDQTESEKMRKQLSWSKSSDPPKVGWLSMQVDFPEGADALPPQTILQTPTIGPKYRIPVNQDETGVLLSKILLSQKPTACNMIDASAQDSSTPIGCDLDGLSTKLRAVPKTSTSISSGRVELTYGTGANAKMVKIPISSCALTLSGPVPAIVRSALKQRLFLRVPEEGYKQCGGVLPSIQSLRMDTAVMHVHVPDVQTTEDGFAIDVDRVADSLKVGFPKIEILGEDGVIGTLTAEVVDPPTVKGNKIQVSYPSQGTKEDAYFLNTGGESDGVAAVNLTKLNGRILNTAQLTVPAPLPFGLASAKDRFLSEWLTATAEDKLQRTPAFEYYLADTPRLQSGLAWRVVTTQGARVRFKDCGADHWGESDCLLRAPLDKLQFEVGETAKAALSTTLTLDRLSVLPDPSNADDCEDNHTCKLIQGREVLLEVRVQLASSARAQSVPLPVRTALHIKCKSRDIDIDNDETFGVANNAVDNGECQITLRDHAEPAPHETTKNSMVPFDLNVFGPQALVVTVQQEGGEKVEKVLVLDKATLETGGITLPVPPGNRTDGKIFTVSIRLASKADTVDGTVSYIGKTLDPAFASSEAARGEFQFVGRLRPWGQFGTGNFPGLSTGLRVYLALTADIGGIRLPASPRDLTSSTQPTGYQFVGPRPGVVLSFEPWNYNTGRNSLMSGSFPIPLALQAGFQMTKIAENDFRVSTIVGGSLSVPLLEGASSQLSSSVGVGLYWENDLRGGDYFLMTFGAKLGSLFGGATK